jgi:hypothetical protein
MPPALFPSFLSVDFVDLYVDFVCNAKKLGFLGLSSSDLCDAIPDLPVPSSDLYMMLRIWCIPHFSLDLVHVDAYFVVHTEQSAQRSVMLFVY